jgi:hypothetical protein
LFALYQTEVVWTIDEVDAHTKNPIDAYVENGVKIALIQFAEEASQNRIRNTVDLSCHAVRW